MAGDSPTWTQHVDPTAGFVVGHGSGGHPVVRLASPAVQLAGRADGGGITSDGGDLVAYASSGAAGVTVTVVRVTLPR